jgi:hypothetical protein
MILLHVTVVALYGLAAFVLWPVAARHAAGALGFAAAATAAWFLPMALLPRVAGWHDVVREA